MEVDGQIRKDAETIIQKSLDEMLPGKMVRKALKEEWEAWDNSSVLVLAVGKAAWEMANAAEQILQKRIIKGLILTKYGHSKGKINGFEVLEAGHPVPDENSVKGAEEAVKLLSEAKIGQKILFLLSGGGSSLMELPVEGISLKDIQAVTDKLLGCGASIQEINRIRKRLSAVKGGKLALLCGPVPIEQIVLSDIIDDDLKQIASGPACIDTTTNLEIKEILNKYHLHFEQNIEEKLFCDTPKVINNVKSKIVGSVRELCRVVAKNSLSCGYQPWIISTRMDCEAREAGKFIASIAATLQVLSKVNGLDDKIDNYYHNIIQKPCAIILGGETVVTLRGNGKGGRNQELALSAALGMQGMEQVVLFSMGSDGTDGPTDAAGGMVDGQSIFRMKKKGLNPGYMLEKNDSYEALKKSGDLIFTGPTGTNVNDVTVLLCK